jgi:hypothetical protein
VPFEASFEEKQTGCGNEEEDVSSYSMSFREMEDTVS